jgi:hypothetical protein
MNGVIDCIAVEKSQYLILVAMEKHIHQADDNATSNYNATLQQ